MVFLEKYKGSPALHLHRKYNVMTGGKSDPKKWQEICKKYTVDDGLKVLRFVEKNYSHFPQMTLTKFKEILADARRDPLASGIEVSLEALGLTEELIRMGRSIHAEYVQDALTKYRDILDAVADMCPELWYRMPPGGMFVVKWYGDIRTYRVGNLTFSHRDKLFQQHFIAAPARIECQLSDARVWEILDGIRQRVE